MTAALTAEGNTMLEDLLARAAVIDLYERYARTLDEGDYASWPAYFAEDCLYRVVARENFELDMPIATWHCESRAMLQDRALALRETAMFRPRYLRHFLSATRIVSRSGTLIESRGDVLLMETLQGRMSQVLLTGEYRDRIRIDETGMCFEERICIYDSLIVPTSLVAPV